MIGTIPVRRAGLAAVVMAVGLLASVVGTASASPAQVVYNNLNTVAPTVNNLPNEDTYSAAPFEFPFGGMIEFSARPGVLKTVTTQVDSFTCEHGQYNLENCFTEKPNKKFRYELTANVYEVGANNEPGKLIASSTRAFKIPYRPTTNVACPATSEGKGFGANCDVGGFLTTVTFTKFARQVVLPEKAIILITDTAADSSSDVVNVGMQTSYKEYNAALAEPFVAEPPVEGGVPAVGSDPMPEGAYVRSAFVGHGFTGFQPVLEVTATP